MNDRQRAQFTRWLNTTALPIPYDLRITALDWLVGTQSAMAAMQGTTLQMEFDLADALQVNMYLDGYWDRKLSNWLAFFAAHSDTLADVGAHVGYFTLLMGHYRRPGAVLHAFEPNPYSFQNLRRNIALNKFAVIANSMAVGQMEGTSPMYIPHRFLAGAARTGATVHHSRTFSQTMMVDMISLDDYCRQHNLAGFDLIKMDIEGGEVQAVVGMERGLRQGSYGVLLIELHVSHMPLAEAQIVYDRLHDAGYRLFYVLPDRLSPSAKAMSGMDYHCCALSPRAYAHLGSPLEDFSLPLEANLPFPVGVE